MDVRKPSVLRVAPTPLYNSFSDVFAFVEALKGALRQPPAAEAPAAEAPAAADSATGPATGPTPSPP